MKRFLILDTNIWFSSEMLGSEVGRSVFHAARDSDVVIVLPEIVELELEKIYIHQVESKIKDIDKIIAFAENHSVPVSVKTKNDFLQFKNSVKPAFASRMRTVSDSIQRTKTSEVVLRNAMLRVLDHAPPSRKENEQFRDCALWEHVKMLSVEGEVYFVTNDNAFFAGEKSSSRRMSQSDGALSKVVDVLEAEIKDLSNPVYIYRRLEDFLINFGYKSGKVNAQKIGGLIFNRILPDIERLLVQSGGEISRDLNVVVSSVVLKNHRVQSLQFSIKIPYIVGDVISGDVGCIIASGSSLHDVVNDTLTSTHLEQISAEWQDENGKHESRVQRFFTSRAYL